MNTRYAKKVVNDIEEETETQFLDLKKGDVFYLYESDGTLSYPYAFRAGADAFYNEDGILEIETVPVDPVIVKAQ